jgi:hypothetical protein
MDEAPVVERFTMDFEAGRFDLITYLLNLNE